MNTEWLLLPPDLSYRSLCLSQDYERGPLINFPLSQSNKDAVQVLDSCLEPEGLLKKDWQILEWHPASR